MEAHLQMLNRLLGGVSTPTSWLADEQVAMASHH